MTVEDCHRAALNNQTAAAAADDKNRLENNTTTDDEELEVDNDNVTATIIISSKDYSPYPDKSNYEYE